MVSKMREKRLVLRRDLTTDSNEDCLMSKGSSFHNLGAATAKAKFPLNVRYWIFLQLFSWPEGTGVAVQK